MPQAASTAELPLGSLSLEVRNFHRAQDEQQGGAANAAATFELVFTTGAPVRRYDYVNGRYYLEVLEVTPEAIDLSRLERGAPLLNSHWAFSLEDQIGVCDQPVVDGGQGTVQALMSRRESVRGIVQDVEDRVVRNVSVGYIRSAIEMVAPSDEAGMWVYRVTRWMPIEVSLVPIPADMDSQVRSATGDLPDGRQIRTFPCLMQTAAQRSPQNPTAGSQADSIQRQGAHMPGTTTTVATDPQQRNSGGTAPQPQPSATLPASPEDAARSAGMQAERQRQADIRAAVQAARRTLGDADSDSLSLRLIDAGVGVDEARREILEALAQRSAATVTRGAANVQTLRDETETMRTRMQDALVLRANPAARQLGDRQIDLAGARNFRGMDMIDMARHSIRQAGGNPDGLSRREIALAALNLDHDVRGAAGMNSRSDFPAILGNTVNRVLRAAYQGSPRTFTGWARQSSNKDFREKAVVQLSELSRLQKVNEGGEYKFMTFGDGAEKYALSKFGGIIAITWETLVNDDLSAFDRLPLMIAEEAAALEGDLVYATLLGNAKMADGKTLFHADHKNLAGAGSAIDIESLDAGRVAIRTQTGLKGRTLNLEPAFLIVGPKKEREANQFTSVNYVAAKGVDINPAYNTSLQVVVDARITDNAWHLSAEPGRVDTVEYSYLEGEEGLFTERKEGFEVDGLLIKARHVFAAKGIDHRGMYRNPGNN